MSQTVSTAAVECLRDVVTNRGDTPSICRSGWVGSHGNGSITKIQATTACSAAVVTNLVANDVFYHIGWLADQLMS